MTKKYFWTMAVVAAFVAGTMMTGTMVDAAKPNTDGDGDGEMEGIIHEITDLLNHATFGLEVIQNAITSVQTDVTDIKTETDKITSINTDVAAIKTETDKIPMVKSDIGTLSTDVGDLQTDVTMVKSDIADIKTQLSSTSEPLTQFAHYRIFVVEDDLGSLSVESTGPMEVIVCADRHNEGQWNLKLDSGSKFLGEADAGHCAHIGVNPGQELEISAGSVSDDAEGFVSIRTTPSAEITITGHGIIDIFP